jgi:hypothetical protein
VTVSSNKSVTAVFTGGTSPDTDTTAPSLSSIASSTTSTTALISWNLSENAQVRVQYGLSTSYGSYTSSTTDLARTAVLTGLTPNTTYHFRLIASDSSKNTSPYTSDYTFTTKAVSTDEDEDGIHIPTDRCPSTPEPLRSLVNQYGCAKPLISAEKFPDATDFNDLDLTAVDTFFLGNGDGMIEYEHASTPYNLVRITGEEESRLNIDAALTIGKGSLTVDAALLPELNRPATITLYGLNLTKAPKIRRNGVICTECVVEQFTGGILKFTVPGF